MSIPKETILEALNHRYAVKIFDTTREVPEDIVHTVLESGRLSPSAFGVESWQFFLIRNKELRTSLREASYGQPKVTDASHLIVIAYRTDGEAVMNELLERTSELSHTSQENLQGFRDMLFGSLNGKSQEDIDAWFRSQAHIPLGIMVETTALLGIDSGPMSGFDQAKVDELLGLKEKNLRSTAMLALGYRGEDPAATRVKVRKSFDKVVTEIL